MSLELVEPPENPKVLKFERPPSNCADLMLQLIEKEERGEITNFVVTWTEKNDDAAAHRYWWGTSSLMCLGLSARMTEDINRWINGEVED